MQITPVNAYGTAKWIVSPIASQGTHTTISTALASASSGDTIFIRSGTYTENPTLKAGVNLCSYDCNALDGNVTINGKCSFAGPGTVDITGIYFQTNSDFFLSITGSSPIVQLNNCRAICTNNTGISLSPSSGGVLTIFNTILAVLSGSISLYTQSGGTMTFLQCNGDSLSTTSSNTSGGSVEFNNCTLSIPVSTSGSGGLNIYDSIIDLSVINGTCVTLSGTGGLISSNSLFLSGTAIAISIGSTATASLISTIIESSNANAISGSGTLNEQLLTFSSSGNTIQNTVTVNPYYLISGSVIQNTSGQVTNPSQPCFFAYLSTTKSNVTGDGTQYVIPFDTAVVNQGSSYNTATGIFTAAVTGNYMFTYSVYANVDATAITNLIVALEGNRYSFRVFQFDQLTSVTTTPSCLNGSMIINMVAGDTISVVAAAFGTTKTISIVGGAPTSFATTSIFSGVLLC